jgi:hypothetical protein
VILYLPAPQLRPKYKTLSVQPLIIASEVMRQTYMSIYPEKRLQGHQTLMTIINQHQKTEL